MGVDGQRHDPADLFPGKKTYPLLVRPGRPQGRSTGIRSQTLQPVASRCLYEFSYSSVDIVTKIGAEQPRNCTSIRGSGVQTKAEAQN